MTALQITFLVIGIYLIIGLIAVTVFDYKTKRIRKRISSYAFDTHQITGNNHTIAIIFTLLAIWILYPALFVGAMQKNGNKELANKEEQS